MKTNIMKQAFAATIITATMAVSNQALAFNFGKAFGLQSSGVIGQIGEVVGYATGNKALSAGSIAADRANGQLNRIIPGKAAAERRITNQFRRNIGLQPHQARPSYYRNNYNNMYRNYYPHGRYNYGYRY